MTRAVFDAVTRVYVKKSREKGIRSRRAAGFETLVQLGRFALETVQQEDTDSLGGLIADVLHGQVGQTGALDPELFFQAEGQQLILKKVRTHDVNDWKRGVGYVVLHGNRFLSSFSRWNGYKNGNGPGNPQGVFTPQIETLGL